MECHSGVLFSNLSDSSYERDLNISTFKQFIYYIVIDL